MCELNDQFWFYFEKVSLKDCFVVCKFGVQVYWIECDVCVVGGFCLWVDVYCCFEKVGWVGVGQKEWKGKLLVVVFEGFLCCDYYVVFGDWRRFVECC